MNATEIQVSIKMDDRMIVLSCAKCENDPNPSHAQGLSVSLDISKALELCNQLIAGIDALTENMWRARNDSTKNQKENENADRENDTHKESETTVTVAGSEREENR